VQGIFNFIGGFFFKNDQSDAESFLEPNRPNKNPNVSSCSIGQKADEGTPDRMPTVLETNGSNNFMQNSRRSETFNLNKKSLHHTYDTAK